MKESFTEEEYLRIIIRHQDDPENDVLQAEVTHLRATSPDFELLYLQVNGIWQVSGSAATLQHIDSEQAVKRFSNRLSFTSHEHPKSVNSGWKWLMRVAAILLLGVAGYVIYYAATNVTYITTATQTATIETVELPDGSKVTLNSNSTLRYPDKLTGDTREVYLLHGTAFFDVARNTEKPFIVNIGNSTVTVLGTSFNIEVSGDIIELNVETGRVEFEAREGGEKMILNAGSGLLYNTAQQATRTFASANRNSSSWLSGTLRFKDAPLSDVFESIENHFGVTIEVMLDDSLSSYNKLNASFDDSTLQEVLDVLTELYPIQVTQQDSTLIVRDK
ncbi:FecR family protein [Pontibacter burrus]|uniref:DUF4974 domain-containing protein n=1 Tax=Pontibacter burrus TaxID=2704466 RepID=A0A6B3LW80_9BACT|nr:FecR domain-containing protein [Pontibacter burrus]NEM97840.1 DUF4974 domain-containing protein [Pontibacter burrus]